MEHRYRSLLLIAVVLVGIGACQSDPDWPDEQDELQALLRDAPLTHVPASAARTSARASALDGLQTFASGPPLGSWTFDDCADFQTQLGDSSFFGNTAFQSVGVTCATGILGQGVAIAAPEDIVYVPDQPNFTFEGGVTVAGWFKPTTVGGTRTLFRKRDKETSSFALLLNGGRFQFVVSLGEGRAISVTSPKRATAGAFQHVAGTYDGSTLRLYVDGLEVTSFAVPGDIPPGPGPVLMGNDGSERRFNGVMDQTLFATHALEAVEVAALTCFPQSPSMVVTPSSIPPTPPGVAVAIDVALTNNNPAGCAALTFEVTTFGDGNLILDPPPFTTVPSAPVPSGTTGHFTVTATAADSAPPESTVFAQFQVTEPTTGFFDFGSVPFEVGEPLGCHVNTARELMIKHVSVVDDPVRTAFDPTSTDPRNGVWTFKHLVESMAPTPEQAAEMVEAMLTTFTTPQTINGFTVEARPGMQSQILDRWPRTTDGALDLAQAPLRLLAIVNRFDLRDLASGDAGEGRFVFAFHDPNDSPMEATMIFEYKLPASTEAAVLGWADGFHALGAMQFGEDYNEALQALTEQFVGRGARPGSPNGSAINAVRTNEIQFGDGIWELREFGLSPTSGLLGPVPVALTPDLSFNFGDTLAAYIDANQAAIIAETHTVPEVFNGQQFQAGAIFNDLGTWFAPGVQRRSAPSLRAQHVQRLPLVGDGQQLSADLSAVPGQRGIPLRLSHRRHDERPADRAAAHVQRSRPPQRRPARHRLCRCGRVVGCHRHDAGQGHQPRPLTTGLGAPPSRGANCPVPHRRCPLASPSPAGRCPAPPTDRSDRSGGAASWSAGGERGAPGSFRASAR